MEDLSVTDVMANYSGGALGCTAGGAYSMAEWPRNIPPPFICIQSRTHTGGGGVAFCFAVQQNCLL